MGKSFITFSVRNLRKLRSLRKLRRRWVCARNFVGLVGKIIFRWATKIKCSNETDNSTHNVQSPGVHEYGLSKTEKNLYLCKRAINENKWHNQNMLT